MRFDHLIHWVPDRAEAVRQYGAAGLHIIMGGEHKGMGTHNALCHFGLTYIEVIALTDPSVEAHERNLAARDYRELLDQGGGAVMFVMAVPDLATARRSLGAVGIEVGEAAPGSRTRPDGTVLGWQTAQITSGPNWRPFLIQWEQPDPDRLADLRWRGIDAPHPLGPLFVDNLVVASLTPEADAAWAGRLTGVQPWQLDGGWRIALAGCDLIFVNPDVESPLPQGLGAQVRRVGFAGVPFGPVDLFGVTLAGDPE